MPTTYTENIAPIEIVLGKPPSRLVRWGISVVAIGVFVLLAVSWFVKYPETRTARVRLSTQQAPHRLTAPTQGYLQLLKQDKQTVEAQTPLAYIHNSAVFQDVMDLDAWYQRTNMSYTPPSTSWQLGDLQTTYQQWVRQCEALQIFRKAAYHQKQIDILKAKVQQYQVLAANLNEQQQITQQELAIKNKWYNTDKQLNQTKVIADLELAKSEDELLQRKKQLKNTEANHLNASITVAELEGQIATLQIQALQEESNLLAATEVAFRQLGSDLAKWKTNYLLIAPFAGTITFTKPIQNKQFVQSAESLFVLVPPDTQITALATVPQEGAGKITVGQDVLVQLADYPVEEYGHLTATIQQIALAPEENNYYLSLRLNKGMQTHYGKKLTYKPDMSGTATIITEDKRLINRFFEQFVKAIRRSE